MFGVFLFRLVALRPAERQLVIAWPASLARYSDVGKQSPLHRRVESLDRTDRRGQAVALASAYMQSDDYVGSSVSHL